MKSPWPGATLPWQWGWSDGSGAQGRPRQDAQWSPSRPAMAVGGRVGQQGPEPLVRDLREGRVGRGWTGLGCWVPHVRVLESSPTPCVWTGRYHSPRLLLGLWGLGVGRAQRCMCPPPPPCSSEHLLGPSFGFLPCQMGLLAPPQPGCAGAAWMGGARCPAPGRCSIMTL